MTVSPGVRLRGYAYQVFYRLPPRWRRRLVRLGSAKFVVGTVVLVRDPQDRIVLLRQPPGYGWGLPAGLLKRGENEQAGAARELFEETGLRVPARAMQPLRPNALVHSSGRWIDLVFTTRVPADATLTVDGGEVYEAAWYRVDALPALTAPTARLLGNYGLGPHAARGSSAADTGPSTDTESAATEPATESDPGTGSDPGTAADADPRTDAGDTAGTGADAAGTDPGQDGDAAAETDPAR
jgi:ADP-ribose pyrophosphatase YjhB (NUDIX family)